MAFRTTSLRRAMLPLAAGGGVLLACARAGGSAAPVPVTGAAAAFAEGLRLADAYRVPAFAERRFTQAEFWEAVGPFVPGPALRVEAIGRSLQGRELRSVTFGAGPVRVLLWSQMHGDEATATMALADIFRFLADGGAHPLRERLGRELTLTFVPMLNPDGAERFERENAAGIDINRDARRLATPEGRALKALRDRLEPHFGFNLHDQSARTRAGPDGPQAAIALLAPPAGPDGAYGEVRQRARLVAATLAAALRAELPGRLAKYDESYSPRAFGDGMQRWGTSTVLIESGALPGDPQKQALRRLHVAAILTALDAIASGAYRDADPADYDRLPLNAGGAYDLLVTGASLVLPGLPAVRADVAVNFDDPVARTGGVVREVGDLQDAEAIDTLDATGLFLHPDAAILERRDDRVWLPVGARARLAIRRAPDPDGPLVRRLE